MDIPKYEYIGDASLLSSIVDIDAGSSFLLTMK